MTKIEIGSKHSVTQKIDSKLLASTMGSGTLDVCATPAVIALMEKAAWELVKDSLDSNITTVGTMISIEHISATPLGAEITATACLTEIDGRKFSFDVSASDNAGIIAKGKHERFSVKSDSFVKKAQMKLQENKD